MRDTRIKDGSYWEKYISGHHVVNERQNERILDNSRSYDQFLLSLYDIHRNQFNITSALYSKGAPIDDVVHSARKLLLDSYPRFVDGCRKNASHSQSEYAGGWADRYQYLSLAIICNLSPAESSTFISAVDFWPERDRGWDLMIEALGYSGREKAKDLLWPEAYENLLHAMDPQTLTVARGGFITAFLKSWLKQMRRGTPGGYEYPEKTKNYRGLWCLEAAAVAVMMDIDDTSFRDHEHYPKDLADWARAQKQAKE